MDIDDLDVGRLCNVVYTTLIADAGAFADRAEVRSNIDRILNRPPPASKARPDRRQGMTPTQAAKIAADLIDYDARAARGKIEAGE